MKKLITLSLAAGLLLAACGGGSTPAPATTAPDATPAPSVEAGVGGLVGIAMPTKSSARWISDGDNLHPVRSGCAGEDLAVDVGGRQQADPRDRLRRCAHLSSRGSSAG